MAKVKLVFGVCFVFFAGQAVFGQSLKVGFGTIWEQNKYILPASVDTLIIWEPEKVSVFPMPYLSFNYPVSKRFSLNLGVQYHVSRLDFLLETWPGFIPDTGKDWHTTLRNIELPLGLSYLVIDTKDFKFSCEVFATPVMSIQDFEPLNRTPQTEDWSQLEFDALNAIESIPRSFFMDYQYGLSVEYKRFGVSFFRVANLNSSISRGYTLYGTNQPYTRKTRSNRLAFYYRLHFEKK